MNAVHRRICCGELELAAPRSDSAPLIASDGAPFDAARLLVRIHGEPAGFVEVPLDAGVLSEPVVWAAIDQRLGDQVERYLDPTSAPDGDDTLRAAPGTAAAVTVIVCTRDRPNGLLRCLEALRRIRHPGLELLVVDNAPSDERTAELLARLTSEDRRLRYVREPRPGLSCARNRGLREARGELVAFTDDDVRVDPLWLSAIARGFHRAEDVGCVTGLVASVSLEHPAEQYFDGRVWWSSSCERRMIRAARAPGDPKLHPFTSGSFGTGANIAFRTEAIRAIGGFDESLGAGSPTRGGEDLDAFVRLLQAGYAIAYEPAALAWHEHRVDDAALRTQMRGYGSGLSAYLCKHLLSRRSGPRLIAGLTLAIAHAMTLRRRSESASTDPALARGLLAEELRGLAAGPLAYLRARRTQSAEHVREVAP